MPQGHNLFYFLKKKRALLLFKVLEEDNIEVLVIFINNQVLI